MNPTSLGAYRLLVEERERLRKSLEPFPALFDRVEEQLLDHMDMVWYAMTEAERDEARRLRPPEPPPKCPERCATCLTPMAKFLAPGQPWYPCTDCGGVLCEKCCDKRKAVQ